jgi:hypothetical protein
VCVCVAVVAAVVAVVAVVGDTMKQRFLLII